MSMALYSWCSGFVTTLSGVFESGGHYDGIISAALYRQPVDVFGDLSGSLFIADGYNNCIRKISSSGTILIALVCFFVLKIV